MTARVTGAINSTVVTLSRNAETTAVTAESKPGIAQGWACPLFADHTARYSNMPQRRETETSTIMPVSKAIVLESIPPDRLVLCQQPRDDRRSGAEQRDDRAIDALCDNQAVADQEDRYRYPCGVEPEEETGVAVR